MSASFITNISFPRSLDEVLYFVSERGRYDVQEIMTADYVEWTAPRDAHVGDTAYFMHSKTSIDTIRHLKRELESAQERIEPETYRLLLQALAKGEGLYASVGGSIFASGIVCGGIMVDDVASRDGLHWRSKHYAPIDSVVLIRPPIHISEFRDFISISRTGAITKLNAGQDVMLRELWQTRCQLRRTGRLLKLCHS